MICSFCGSEVKDGDKFCMVCGTAVQAMNEAAAPAPEIQMPEVQAPNIPEVTVGEPAPAEEPVAPAAEPVFESVAPAAEPVAEPTPVVDPAASQGAYFADQQNAPAPEPVPVYAAPQPDGQPVYGQPVYGQPVYAQPVYGQPQPQPFADGQPVYAQPVYAQPQPQPVANGQTVYAQPAYAQPVYGQQPATPMVNGVPVNTTPNLVFGIVSLCLGLSFWLSIGGIILGAIGLSKSNEVLSQCGCLDTKGKVGRHLSRAGLIIGIVMTVFLLIFILAYLAEEVW